MIEAVAELDDELARSFLEGEELTVAELREALRLGRCSSRIVPVLCGSALRNKGIQPLLDAVVDYLPSPLDVPPMTGGTRAPTRRSCRAGRRRALRRAGLQDHLRPVRRPLAYLPRLLRHAQTGSHVLNPPRGPQGAHRSHRAACTPTTARRSTRSTPATSSPWWACKRRYTGDTLCDLDAPDRPGRRSPSPSRSSRWPSSRRRRPTRTSWRSPCSAWPRKTPPSASDRRGDRPDASSPAWASCTWRCSSTA